MTEIQRAIVFLQEARDKIESQAGFEADLGYRDDLNDIAEDITAILCALESFKP